MYQAAAMLEGLGDKKRLAEVKKIYQTSLLVAFVEVAVQKCIL